MTFTIFTQNILNAISMAERSCGKNLQLPIINYLLFAIEKNKMKVSATNLEQGIVIEILGKSESTHKIAIPSKMVSELLRNVKSEKVTISVEKTTLKIETKNHKAVIQGLSGEEFPIIPKIENSDLFEIPSLNFKEAMDAVIVAVARSGIRPELAGVYFEWNAQAEESSLTIASTDSFRLAEYNFKTQDLKFKDKSVNGSCILPFAAAQEIARIAGEISEEMIFTINETQFGVSWGNGTFVSRLLEGSFPNYRAIIPKEFKTEINCRRKDLADLIRQSGLFASKINDIKVSVDAKEKSISIKSHDSAKGEYDGKLECAVKGEDITITFNYQFLLDGIERISTEHIKIGFNDSNSPALVEPAGNGIFYRYIVMPLRI